MPDPVKISFGTKKKKRKEKKKVCQLKILYPVKISFMNKREIKTDQISRNWEILGAADSHNESIERFYSGRRKKIPGRNFNLYKVMRAPEITNIPINI